MRIFHCAHCRNLVYFENHLCVSCGHKLAYLPDRREVTSLDPDGDQWVSPIAAGKKYRLCANYTDQHICNWAIPAESPQTLCDACALTRVIPDLSQPEWQSAWYRLEVAKRRLVYELVMLNLPVIPKSADAEHGLAFEFLADPVGSTAPHVMTGHADGVITIALAEADDAERERRRLQLHEPIRTLLGHFRHEIGHYYWDRLIRDGEKLEAFRAVFGDERADYNEALKTHYSNGPAADWSAKFITAYASAHPWEDWAETWAHYLHMVDALETAESSGVRIESGAATTSPADEFSLTLAEWHGLTHMLNNLNRSLGLNDAYPFVLSAPAVAKMRFVHDVVEAAAKNPPAPTVPLPPPTPGPVPPAPVPPPAPRPPAAVPARTPPTPGPAAGPVPAATGAVAG